jgi:isoleucyl-tRNA synthetase
VFEPIRSSRRALARTDAVAFSTVSHSYPHCWRCSSAGDFLATSQWFISMDGLRDAAIAECNATRWIPPGGANG